MTTYYTADTHFNHANIIQFCGRPYSNVELMTEDMIRIWNETVNEDDDLYHLGDFAMGNKTQALEILAQLNGRKHLIRGNHDPNRLAESSLWESVHQYLRLGDLIMFHFPIEEWNNMKYGTIHLHGHTHGRSTSMTNRYDVGWDVYGRPVTIEEILS